MRARARRIAPAIPLCSTADIAFLLLIFFIVLAKGAQESSIDLTPASTAVPLEGAGNAVCSVAVDKGSTIYLDGQPVVASALKDLVGGRLGDRPPGQRRVLLKIDRDVPARVFQQVMLDVADAGGEMFRIMDPERRKD